MHLLHVAKAAGCIVCWTLGHSDYANPSSHGPQGYQLCLQTRKMRLLGVVMSCSGPHEYQAQAQCVYSGHLQPPPLSSAHQPSQSWPGAYTCLVEGLPRTRAPEGTASRLWISQLGQPIH